MWRRWAAALLVAGTVAGSAIVVVTPFSGGGGASCTTTISSGANIRTALSTVTPGGTVCLGAGSYTWSGGTINKAALTKVTPAAGVSRASVTMGSIDLDTSNNIQIDGITITGEVTIGDGTPTPGTNLKVTNNDISGTGKICVLDHDNTDLIQGNLFRKNTSQACSFYEGRIEVLRGASQAYGTGIVIDSNTFDDTGQTGGVCTDMIQSTAAADQIKSTGWTVSNNTFIGLNEGNCGDTHADPIQPFASSFVTITRNYFVDDSSDIMNGDCNGPVKVTHNVIDNTELGANAVRMTGTNPHVIDHNVLLNNAIIFYGDDNCTTTAPSQTITNNICEGGGIGIFAGSSMSGTIDHNHGCGGSGATNVITGTIAFTGGATPSTWAGFDLAFSSAGYHAAADGSSIGINP